MSNELNANLGASVNTQRVITYVDGFNLYFGMRSAGMKRMYWLDVAAVALALLRPDQALVATKYFTARTSGGLKLDTPDQREKRDKKLQRQCDYLDALKSHGGIEIIEGWYSSKLRKCRLCSGEDYRHEEKKTDAAIATEMVADAFLDRFDVALVISGDTDVVPPIQAIRKLLPSKVIISIFPPDRGNKELKGCVNGYLYLGKNVLRACQLPETIIDTKGRKFLRPAEWR
ncbi:MAG: NYN domain-containing protein [Planctomycetota bacterium]|nr:NYN domain-containing protein [Planctomycetota bacterium]